MDFGFINSNIDYIAFATLVICLGATAVTRWLAEGRAKKHPKKLKKISEEDSKYRHLFAHETRIQEALSSRTSKSLRKAYRKIWAEKILAAKAYPEAREIIRNLIMTNYTFLSAVLISFGLILTQFSTLKDIGGALPEVKILSISTLLVYALFSLISESRILNYVPIVLWVDEEIIEKMQNEDKADYIAQLMDQSFDRFSDSIRAVFFAVICVFWFFNAYAFIMATIILTAIILNSDLERKITITIF